jgi:hypothetical protein
MSQFPGDKGSEFLAGTLGGPGYGEFPLGSAGPRVDTSDPRYRAPPQQVGGFFDEMFDRLPQGQLKQDTMHRVTAYPVGMAGPQGQLKQDTMHRGTAYPVGMAGPQTMQAQC